MSQMVDNLPLCGNEAPPVPSGCLVEAAEIPISDNDIEYFLVANLRLARRPRILERSEQAELLLQILDLEKTMRRRPEWGNTVRKILQKTLGVFSEEICPLEHPRALASKPETSDPDRGDSR
jgi:hypothetical protein